MWKASRAEWQSTWIEKSERKGLTYQWQRHRAKIQLSDSLYLRVGQCVNAHGCVQHTLLESNELPANKHGCDEPYGQRERITRSHVLERMHMTHWPCQQISTFSFPEVAAWGPVPA